MGEARSPKASYEYHWDWWWFLQAIYPDGHPTNSLKKVLKIKYYKLQNCSNMDPNYNVLLHANIFL